MNSKLLIVTSNKNLKFYKKYFNIFKEYSVNFLFKDKAQCKTNFIC